MKWRISRENLEAFEAYEAIFPKKEKTLQPSQLPQFCQSCGMPLTKNEDCGTNADGSKNFDYCKYCYADGKFLQDCTMDEMIEHCAQFVDEHVQFTTDKQPSGCSGEEGKRQTA